MVKGVEVYSTKDYFYGQFLIYLASDSSICLLFLLFALHYEKYM